MKSRICRWLDILDYAACRSGLSQFPDWSKAKKSDPLRLYAGKLRRGLPQFKTHWGVTPFFASSRNVQHDVSLPYPIEDNSVEAYQSEDVFEHIPLEKMPAMFDEIFRVLKPGGLFRLSVPDYNFDMYKERTQRDSDGGFLFDPGGGGHLENGKVVGGGHLWFPTVDLMQDIFSRTKFSTEGDVKYLHYTNADGSHVIDPIDYSLGYIQRTPDHDARVADNPRPISIVIDAWKH